jgi:glyoxylase-like metal-dependent hydrolase (beta-lactamase superfamily II)
MAVEIVPDLYAVRLGFVNAFLLRWRDELILIDTGLPGSEGKILATAAGLGYGPADIRHILVTHLHADHTGSLAALKRATGAPATMHPLDAALTRQGQTMRPAVAGPGLANRLIFAASRRLTMRAEVEPAEVEREVHDNAELPGGLTAIHAPGHAAGQLCFFWPRHGGVLFAADACGNLPRLGYSILYEDLALAERTLARLARLEFQVACFGHGNPLLPGAAARFRQKWGAAGD